MRILSKPALFSIVSVSLVSSSCVDPRKEILRLFSEQGLTVLQPARDYVAVGGLVVLPTKGRPAYLDPFDKLTDATDQKAATDFRAIVMGQTVDTKVGLDVALNLASSVVKLPLGVSAKRSQEVQLDQIDTTGDRLIPTAVAAAVKKSATASAIKEQLGVKGNRVFMVQEVYRANTLSVKSTKAGQLQVSVGGGSVPECTDKTKSESDTSASKKKTPNPDAGAASGAKPPAAADKGSPSSNTAATPKASTDAKGAADKSSTAESAKPSLAVGVCKVGSATLTMKTDQTIPFAVRLVELQQTPGGDISIRYTGFKFPGSLGNSDTEKITTVISQDAPLLQGLEHRARKR
jgi:hypothetical protein